MYSADNPSGPVVPGTDISTQAGPFNKAFETYLTDTNLYYCPDFPVAWRAMNASSYEWDFSAFSPDDRDSRSDILLADLQRQGVSMYPMM